MRKFKIRVVVGAVQVGDKLPVTAQTPVLPSDRAVKDKAIKEVRRLLKRVATGVHQTDRAWIKALEKDIPAILEEAGSTNAG